MNNMKTLKSYFSPDKAASFILYSSILTFIIAFNFSDNPPSGWYQQFLPNLNNRPLADIQFIDSLNGYAVTGDHTGIDPNYILKTINGGDNWSVIDSQNNDLSRVQFQNVNTGYVCGESGTLMKTTNGGMNWIDVNSSLTGYIEDIFVLNEDTIWYTDQRVVIGGLFRTTDAGATWVRQFYANGNIPSKIYMINAQVGFFSSGNASRLNKTTNSGFNWISISGENGFQDIYFADSLIGWKSNGFMKKTTDGGLSWDEQTLPITSTSGIINFQNINGDSIWGVGGEIFQPGIGTKGIIYKTTNSGINWGYQVPNVSTNNIYYYECDFINKSNGWGYTFFNGVHTVSGGDSFTVYTNIENINTEIPNVFTLFQNHPNPFNPITVIGFELRVKSYVRLIIYDVSGKEIIGLINQAQNSGTYEIRFDGSSLSSGVYFYRLEAEDLKGNLYSETKKMILIR